MFDLTYAFLLGVVTGAFGMTFIFVSTGGHRHVERLRSEWKLGPKDARWIRRLNEEPCTLQNPSAECEREKNR